MQIELNQFQIQNLNNQNNQHNSISVYEFLNESQITPINWPKPLKIPEELESNNISSQFLCPISQCIMSLPAITPYGITYDYESICNWLKSKDTDPTNNLPLKKNELYPNRSIQNMIEEFIAKE